MKKEPFSEKVCVPPLGIRLFWKDGLLDKTSLFWAQTECMGKSSLSEKVFRTLKQYLDKFVVSWDFLPLNWNKLSKFQRKVLKKLKESADFGRFITYKDLAIKSGVPKGARAVGQVLKSNPWPLIVPCHRVLNSNGRIGGFSCGVEFKKFLLRLEGIDWKE